MNTKTYNETEINVIALMELQKQRSGIIKMMNAQRSQITSYIARMIGYSSFDDEKERKRNWGLSELIFKSIDKNKPLPDDFEYNKVVELVAPAAIAVSVAIKGLINERANIESNMIQTVKNLPACDWWVAEKGRSYLGLAVLIGEAGDLHNYENPAKLWKRFGVAVMGDVRQGGLKKGSCAEAWIEHGYCPRRRSVLWTIGDSLLKTNGMDGTYKKIYDERKAYEKKRLLVKHIADGKTEKSFKPGHSHNRAKRYVEKRLLRDLWEEWNN